MTDKLPKTITRQTIARSASINFDRWRIAGGMFAALVAQRALDLAKAERNATAGGDDANGPTIDPNRLRELNALVLAAQRVKELENHYEQKVHRESAEGVGDDAGLVARFDALAKAAGVSIRIERRKSIAVLGRPGK